MAPRKPMTEKELKSWVLRRLGAPRLSLELTPCHLDDIYEDSVDWYMGNKGVTKTTTFEVFPKQVVYPYPEDADTVIQVYDGASATDLSLIFSPYSTYEEYAPFDTFSAPQSGGPYSSLVQGLQYNDMAQKILSGDFDWQYDDNRRVVIISPVPKTGGLAAMVYKSNCWDPEDLTYHDHLLFKEYMLAQAKLILGRIRNRYDDEIVGADGSRRNDGRALLDEGLEATETLTEKLKQSNYPMLIVTG